MKIYTAICDLAYHVEEVWTYTKQANNIKEFADILINDEEEEAIADLESFLDVVNIVEIITVENDKLIAIDSVFYEDKIEEAIKKNEK